MKEEHLGKFSPSTSTTHSNLGVALCQTGRAEDLDEAMSHHMAAMGISEATYGPKHYRTALILSNIALVNRLKGNVELALEQHLEVARHMCESFGTENHHRVLITYNNIGQVRY